MSDALILEKLDELKDGIAHLDKHQSLNKLAYDNLNAELQEHKKDEKWRSSRNIAIVALMFTALSCYIAFSSMSTAANSDPQVAIVKELKQDDRNN